MEKHNVPIQSLIDHIKTAVDVDPWAKEMAEELLKEQEEVVRCKDCKHRYKRSCGYFYANGQIMRDDWFCADGEMKDTE